MGWGPKSQELQAKEGASQEWWMQPGPQKVSFISHPFPHPPPLAPTLDVGTIAATILQMKKAKFVDMT